jgi:serine protease inhibitor
MSIDEYDVARMRVQEQYRPSVGEITLMANKMKAEYHDPVIAREMLNQWIEEETSNRILQDVEENGL